MKEQDYIYFFSAKQGAKWNIKRQSLILTENI